MIMYIEIPKISIQLIELIHLEQVNMKKSIVLILAKYNWKMKFKKQYCLTASKQHRVKFNEVSKISVRRELQNIKDGEKYMFMDWKHYE